MTIRVLKRRGKRRLVLDIPYKDTSGHRTRYRRDAEVQTMAAARDEERRRLAALARTGSPFESINGSPDGAAPTKDDGARKQDTPTFGDLVKRYLADFAPSHLKPSTRRGYEAILKGFLLPRLRDARIGEIDATVMRRLDVELVDRELTASTRRQMQSVIRSVLCKYAVEAGDLAEPPRFPRMPKAGRKIVKVLSQEELVRILTGACPAHRLAFLLASHAGLRAGEIRGLRWRDVDLRTGHLVVRESVCHPGKRPL